MIAKFDKITGENLAALLTFIHGDENSETVYRSSLGGDTKYIIVRIKACNPENHGDDMWYNLTLDILDWITKGNDSGQNDRVDPKYFLKVYEILGRSHLTEEN